MTLNELLKKIMDYGGAQFHHGYMYEHPAGHLERAKIAGDHYDEIARQLKEEGLDIDVDGRAEFEAAYQRVAWANTPMSSREAAWELWKAARAK